MTKTIERVFCLTICLVGAAGCASQVGMGASDGAAQDANTADTSADGTAALVCHLADGTTCAPGMTCRTSDGCTSCACDASGNATCTSDPIRCRDASVEASVDASADASRDASADASRDAGGDAGGGPRACVLPNGRTCAAGATCGAGDACNVCTCGPDGALMCTARPCRASCGARSDCGATEICQFEPDTCGGRGGCAPVPECFAAQPFCACGGATYMSCTPDRPTVHAGACTGPMPTACRLSDGSTCPAETTCPAGDGCNRCFCNADGRLTCTDVDCM